MVVLLRDSVGDMTTVREDEEDGGDSLAARTTWQCRAPCSEVVSREKAWLTRLIPKISGMQVITPTLGRRKIGIGPWVDMSSERGDNV